MDDIPAEADYIGPAQREARRAEIEFDPVELRIRRKIIGGPSDRRPRKCQGIAGNRRRIARPVCSIGKVCDVAFTIPEQFRCVTRGKKACGGASCNHGEF